MVPPAHVLWHQEWRVVISTSDTLIGIGRNAGFVPSRPRRTRSSSQQGYFRIIPHTTVRRCWTDNVE